MTRTMIKIDLFQTLLRSIHMHSVKVSWSIKIHYSSLKI